MMRLYQSLLDNDEELFNATKYNIFKLLNVYKIYVLGPDEPTNKDIPEMMEFLDYIDWDQIKNDGLYIDYKRMQGPIYNGFTKEYRDKINIISSILCRLLNQNKDVFDIKKELKKYLIPNYKSKYNVDIKYYRSDLHGKLLGLYFENKIKKYTYGIEIMMKL